MFRWYYDLKQGKIYQYMKMTRLWEKKPNQSQKHLKASTFLIPQSDGLLVDCSLTMPSQCDDTMCDRDAHQHLSAVLDFRHKLPTTRCAGRPVAGL